MNNALDLYEKYHLSREDDRSGMFQILADNYSPENILYPGCFVHLTPSLFFSKATYVDMDKRAKEFFSNESVRVFIESNKLYSEPAQIIFHHQDYRDNMLLEEARYDLLISQYAGFVSMYCSRFLKLGGHLVVNNSHGDASLASLDPHYKLVSVIHRRGNHFRIHRDDLDLYLIPKKGSEITREALLASGRGVGYSRPAFAYIFERI